MCAASPMIFGLKMLASSRWMPGDPRQHQQRRAERQAVLVRDQGDQQDRDRRDDRPEDRHQAERRRDHREQEAVLDAEDHQADVGQHAVDQADQQLPADHPGEADVEQADQLLVGPAVLQRHQPAHEVHHPPGVDEDERREHQRDHEVGQERRDAADQQAQVAGDLPVYSLPFSTASLRSES
jgi:hypothetical protein